MGVCLPVFGALTWNLTPLFARATEPLLGLAAIGIGIGVLTGGPVTDLNVLVLTVAVTVFAGIRCYACVLKWNTRDTQPFFGSDESDDDDDAPAARIPSARNSNSPEAQASIAAAEEWRKERRF